MMIKKLAAVALTATLASASVFAQAEMTKAEREKLANILTANMGTMVAPDTVRSTSLPGIAEARLPTGPIFIAKDGSFIVQGTLYDVGKKVSVTQKSIEDMQQFTFTSLPLKEAIRIVKGDGKRKLVTFEDPNCGYCKKFAEELGKIDNLTVYVFPVAMIAPNSAEIVTNILCSDKPEDAWQAMVLKNKAPVACPASKKPAAEKRLQSIQKLAQKYYVSGTPTLLFDDNTRVNGFIGVGDLHKRLTGIK